MEWDDLRYVLAVQKSGSVAGAARALAVSQATVFRRIEKIEKSLGVRLFDRRQTGYVATPAGQEIVDEAGELEDRINALELRVWRNDEQARGTVRVTTTDTVATMLLPDILARLRAAHPKLTVEVIISHQALNILKRDADIAIRHLVRRPPETLIGHKLATVKCAVYCSDKVRQRGAPIDLAAQAWVAPLDSPSDDVVCKWLHEQGHQERIALRCNSYVVEAMAVRAGVGVGLLSCFVADRVGGLRKLTPPVAEVGPEYWALMQREMRTVARVSIVYAFIREAFAEMAPLFAGDTLPVA